MQSILTPIPDEAPSTREAQGDGARLTSDLTVLTMASHTQVRPTATDMYMHRICESTTSGNSLRGGLGDTLLHPEQREGMRIGGLVATVGGLQASHVALTFQLTEAQYLCPPS